MFTNEKSDNINLASKQTKFTNKKLKINRLGKLKNYKIAYYSFIFFILMVSYVSSVFIGSSMGFFIGITIKACSFFVFPIITMFIYIYILKSEEEKFYILIPLMSLIIYFILCFGLIYLNNNIWDFSSDSLNYHEPMIINLFNGWNPIYNSTFNHTANIWDIHYPKGNAIFAATIYKLTNKIAASKILSLLIPIITSGMVFSFIKVLFGKKGVIYGTVIAMIGAIILLFNPVNIEEFLTFYVDSTLGGMIIILTIVIVYLVMFEDLKKFKYATLVFIIPFISNIKFTGLTYSIFILGAMFLFYLIYGEKKEIKHNFYFLAIMFIFTFCIVGFNPYINNLISNLNPFYPLMGKGSTNILAPNVPMDMRNKCTFIQNIYSLIAKPTINNNGIGAPASTLSGLFIFNSSVAKYYAYAAPTTRGFGLLSFLIEPMSLLMMIFIFIKERKNMNKYLYMLITFISVGVLLMALQVGGYWWARYIPYFWIVPVLTSICFINYKNYITKFIGIVLILLMVGNTFIFIPAFKYKVEKSNDFKSSVFSQYSPKTIVKGALDEETIINRYNEYNIHYKIVNHV